MGNETELDLFDESEPADTPTTGAEENDIDALPDIQDGPVQEAVENESGSPKTQSTDGVNVSPDSVDNEAADAGGTSDDVSNANSDPPELDLNLDDLATELESIAEGNLKEEETDDAGEALEIENLSEAATSVVTSDEDDENDFLGLSDEDIDEQKPEAGSSDTLKSTKSASDAGKAEKSSKNKKKTKKTVKSRKTTKFPIGGKRLLQTAGLVFFLVIAGVLIVYTKPLIFKIHKKAQTTLAQADIPAEPVRPVQNRGVVPERPNRQNTYLSRLEEADRLRDELLTKKDEIFKLRIHLQSGVAELEEETRREVKKAGIASFEQALQDKRVELNLRTIQRRQSYIRELGKPAQWTHHGSEELLYLKRKAELDLAVMNIADHVDMDRHMRHIGAAIEKFRPSAEKLAVDPGDGIFSSLEDIWNQIGSNQKNNQQMLPESTNEEIIDEICSGYFHRTNKLSSITDRGAKCLAKLEGPDLFLNGLTELSPAEAKTLFQWSGSWICLNGIKTLSPEAARHLFKWNGDWISLNGLTEFPTELARYLMKWDGNQLELMGLEYDSKKADKNALKYLALWEAMGGKLFISDDIREKMKHLVR
jgi:hypothetical protein